MIKLSNDSLMVEILDPVEDRDRFGPRYCTGGYIFQVIDKTHGPLLSGPTYPESFNWFDGQGLPEAFHQQPIPDPSDPASPVLVVGIGRCDLAAGRIVEYCRWNQTIDPDGCSARFSTVQTTGNTAFELERTVTLIGRSLSSESSIDNTGSTPIPIRWFPHPFFPHPADDELFLPGFAVSFPESEGFKIGENGFVRRKNWPWTDGCYQAVDHHAKAPSTILQRHPKLGMVAVTLSYVPGLFPIWGNRNTFSFEPYLERTIAAGQRLAWSITYHW